jgi:hypothetical protein
VLTIYDIHEKIIMKTNYYIFDVEDQQVIVFFDIMVWSITKCSNHNYEESIELVNSLYKSYPLLWEDYWYEHEGFFQLIVAIFYEESGKGKYRDINFSAFRNCFLSQHRDSLSSLGIRHRKILSRLEFYPIEEDIEARMRSISICLDPFWTIFNW